MGKLKNSLTVKVGLTQLWNNDTFITNRHFLVLIHRFIGIFKNHLIYNTG